MIDHDYDGQLSCLYNENPHKGWTDIHLPLLGHHQMVNACTAFAALCEIEKMGWEIQPGAIQNGFAKVEWEGRFEIISRDPYIVLDSAHNRDSAAKLRATIVDYFPRKKVVLVFGASEDKDVAAMSLSFYHALIT